MLDENQKKQLETLAVEMVLELRSEYLASVNGRPSMSYWEQLQNRMRSAARSTTTASEWVTQVMRRMQIASLRKSASRSLVELVRFCDEHDAHLDFLAMVERDNALLIALAQLIAEERKRPQVAEETPNAT